MNSSNILGFFLGVLICCFFKKTIYHGPDSNIIRTNIYYDTNTNMCFKLIPTLCDVR